MDGNSLLFAGRRQRNADGVAGRIDAGDQSSEAVPLPLFALAGLFFRDVRLFHGDDRGGSNGFTVIGKFAAHKNAVAGLEIRQLDRRGVLQVLLAGRDANEPCSVLDFNDHITARIGGQSYGIPGNRLDGSHGSRCGRSLSSGLLRRRRLTGLIPGGISRDLTQRNRRC